ncbi:TPA: aminopeptidase P family protein [bacterium]|nr:aminopeptidase P family protein [bacterium]
MNNIDKLKNFLKESKLDAILVSKNENLFYYAGFNEEGTYLLVTLDKSYLLVNSLVYSDAKNKCKNMEVILVSNYFETVNELLTSNGSNNIAFEKSLPYLGYERLKDATKVTLVPTYIDSIRMIKSSEEIKIIKKACRMADKCYKHILGYVKVGMSEKEIEKEMHRYLKELGASKEAFDFIVASGKRGALPHGRASNKKIKKGELVTLDFGCFYHSYCSDMTRTFALDKTNEKLVNIYNLVKEANELAISLVRPGIRVNYLHNEVSLFFKKHNMDQYFIHNLGHGLGLEVHEEPRISPSSETLLQEGMIITIEPGLYIEGLGGVRIEDVVLVTKDGREVLTKSSKELISVSK